MVFIMFQLVFEGVVGNGYQGDVAIDDISVKSGACNSQGKLLILFLTCDLKKLRIGIIFQVMVLYVYIFVKFYGLALYCENALQVRQNL